MLTSQWTDEDRDFVIKHYATKSARTLAEALTQRTGRKFTKNMVVGFAYRRSLDSGDRRVCPFKTMRLLGTMLTEDDLIGCRHINGNPLPLRRNMYCCQPTMPGTDYCEAHRAQHRVAGSATVPYVGRAAML